MKPSPVAMPSFESLNAPTDRGAFRPSGAHCPELILRRLAKAENPSPTEQPTIPTRSPLFVFRLLLALVSHFIS